MADDNKIIAEILVEGVDKFKADLKGAQGSVEQLNAEVAQTGDVSKQAMTEAAQSTASYRTQLKNMTSDLVGLNLQLAEMKDAGKAGTKEFTELEKRIDSLRKKAGELKDAMQDAGEQIRATGSDTAGLDKAIRVVGSASAAFQVFEGAATLAGKGSEDLQKALVRLNGVMAITQGLQQIQNELVRDDSVFKGIAAGATRIYTAAQNTLAKATGLVRVALAGLGIGAVIGLIYAAIEAYKSFTGQTEELADATDKLAKAQEAKNKGLEDEIKFRVNIGKITQQQAAEELLASAQKDQIASAKNLVALLKERQKLIDRISDSEGQLGLLSQLKALEPQIDKARKLFQQNTQEVANAQSELSKFNKTVKETTKVTTELDNSLGGEGTIIDRIFNTTKQSGLSRTQQEVDRLIGSIKKLEEVQKAADGGAFATGVARTREQVLQQQFEKAEGYYGQIQGAITQTSQLISNATQIRAENEIAALDRKRQRGLISEKQYEKEVAKIKNDAAQKQRRAEVINAFAMIPMAVLSAFTNTQGGIVAKGIAAGIAGAFALAQASLVAAAPIPKFRDGGSVAKRLGLIKGKSHEAGGVPIEVEGDEFVMSKKAVKHYGVDFMDKVNNMKLSPVVTMSPKLEQMKQTDYKLYEHLATLGGYMKQDYRTNETGNRILLNIQETLKRTNTYV